MLQSSILSLLLLSIYTFALKIDQCSFWHNPEGETLRPAPGDILSLLMESENGDPSRVDVNLYNVDQGNETVGLSNLDPVRDANVGFEIPWVPPSNFWIRIYASQTKTLLIQSSTFQIYGPNATESTIPPPLISASVTESGPPSSSTAEATPKQDSSRPSKSHGTTGIIVGATIGGVALIVLITVLAIYLRHLLSKERATKTAEPFSAVLDYESKSSSPLPSPSLKPDVSSEAAQKAASRAEALRRDREKLDREVAALKGTVRSLTRSAASHNARTVNGAN